jgi:hypothetical protein
MLLRDQEVYDEYAIRRKLSKPIFIRAQEACVTLGVDLGTVEWLKELEHPPWINNNSYNMITQLMALPKGPGMTRIRAELETIIEEEGLWEYARVYTDGSVMYERSGCEIVMSQSEVKIRLAGQLSIFNAEAQAIKITRRWGVDKRIIMTDSLSNIVAQEALKDLMAEEGSNLKLMWVPAHVGIKGNETADKAAKKPWTRSWTIPIRCLSHTGVNDWSGKVGK